MFLRRYILLLLTLLSFTLQAQQYPVDVQVFVTPPYPQSLRGYADTFEQKIQAHFLLKDLSTGGRPFVLRFSLEDFQGQTIAQTPDYITPYLVNLSPGVRRTLTNIDFKSLLRYENLYGINEATYNGLLPEGTYFIGLSLYDVATGRPVSNKGRAMIQVRRYSPPVLTMPQKGEVLTKKNAFQHIVFQWMPRDVAPFMQYEFTLKEVWDLALVPEEAFMTGRLVYQTKTFSPSLAYTNMMPILLENKRYVWQVRAFTNNPNNPNEQSYFKNNGNSETFYFDLVSHCEAPKFLTAITESTSAQLRWSAQAMMPNQEYPYKVMYREKGKTWKSQKVSMPYAKLTNLKRGRTYIYKVGVACGLETAYSTSVFGEESYMYSTEQEFTTTEQIDEKSQVQCGVKPEIRIKNTNPLQDNLYPNTTFTAGDFPVTVLNATGSNGVYSGEGYVKVPYLQDTKIKVVFNGIKLNTERQLIEGKLVTTYDETERNVEFLQEAFGEIFGDKGKKDQKMPFEVSEVQVDTLGRIIVIGKVDPKTGIAPKVTLPKGRDYVITDSKGKVYQLDESGKVTAEGTREQGTQLAQQAGKGDSKNPPISNKHFKVEWLFNDELANDTNGEIPYKALVKGKTSSFELRIQPADTTKYNFFFHTENGVKVDAESKGEGLYKITRKGAFDFAQEELWVVAKEKKDKKGKKEELIGKCILVHLSPKEVNVALVPTQSGQNLQEAIAQVQQIYEKVGVTLHITTEKPFDISDQLKNGTLPTESEFGDLSTYSPEQNAVIAKFTTNRKPKDNTYYIFLVNDGTGDHGYMRLGGQYGFVYSANARTIAHELGHGIFKLEHPFKGKNADKGKTTALMDYNQGQDFFYRDWKQINDPKVKLYAFQGQSEGEYNVNAHLGLTPDGVIFDTFFFKGKKINTTIEVAPDKYTIQKISYQGNQYYWDKQSKAFVGTEGAIKVKREAKNINNKVNIYRSRKDGCTYDYLTIPWETKDEQSTNIVQTIEKYIAQYNESYWRIAPYTVRDASCGKEFFTHLRERDLQECSTAEINEGRKILQGLLAEANPERVTLSVNNYCMAAISGLTYGEIEKLFDIIASQERITEHSEVALLRLMSGIKTTDYKRFYTHLEANGNKLLKHLIDEIDDASVNFLTDKKNYTNFIGALVWMFNHNPASIEDRWGKNEEDFAKRTLNLNPISYSEYSSFMYSSSTSKKNEGEYVSATGNIKLYDVYTIKSSKTVLVKGDVPIDVVEKREPIAEVSPLTPLIIVPDKDKLPLLQTALEGNNLGNEVYIVPAIFLKYSKDKIRNDYIEKDVITTLDVATIALSGGTALATKVHWVRRAWALAEVVGAVGDIGVNVSQHIDPNSSLGQVVNSYNLAMGVIGIKNLGQAGYKFAKNLPQATKELLQKNGNLRTKLISYYQKWQTEVAQLDNPSQAEKQLVEKQAEVWKALGFENKIDDIASLVSKWDDLSREEILRLYNSLSKTNIVSSSEKVINQRMILDELNSIGNNFINPYSFTDEIIDIVLKEDAIFIRAFSEYQTGRWMLSLEEFKKINSVEELVKKTALPLVDQKGNIIFPNKLALVRVPKGTTIRKSVARPQDWGGQGHLPGGAIQFEIRDFNWKTMENWFKPIGKIEQFIKK